MNVPLLSRIALLEVERGAPLVPLGNTLSGAKVKGFTLVHLVAFMEKNNPQWYSQWRSGLPKAWQQETEKMAFTSVSWLPIEYYSSGIDWLARNTGSKTPLEAAQLGFTMAKLDIGLIFRVALSVASPAYVMLLSGRFWKSYFDTSQLVVVSSTKSSVVAEVQQWPLALESSFYELAGSLVAWMEASRANDVHITKLRWTAKATLHIEATWS